MKRLFSGFLLCAIVGGTSGAALAQSASNCAERGLVLARLAETYGETRQSVGLGANNSVVEVFASAETGTWTITVTLPSGVTCMVASGQAFERLDEDLPAHAREKA